MSTNTTTTAGRDFIGYVRVSTGEQHASGLGLDAQRSAIRSACDVRGWTLSAIYDDAASGGSLVGRPGLRAALERLASGGSGGLIVAKLDRLSRSIKDFAGLMDTARSEGWALVALDLGVDTTTPAGEMMANVMSSFAQYERRLIGQRTKDALAELKGQGVKLGRPRSIDREVIDYIRSLRADGLSYRAVSDRLNAEGVPTGLGGEWHHTTVYRALRSRAGDSP